MLTPVVTKGKFIAFLSAVEIISLGGLVYALWDSPLVFEGMATVAMSLSTKLWGQPAQIIRLFHMKSARAIAWSAPASATLSYVCWVVYGIRTNDEVIFVSQTAGVVVSIMTFHLVVLYRRYPREQPRWSLGFHFWLWEHSRGSVWQEVSYHEYVAALRVYRSIRPHPSGVLAMRRTGKPMLWDELVDPWYWCVAVEGDLWQGAIADGEVPSEPSSQEIIEGTIRLCGQLRKSRVAALRESNRMLDGDASRRPRAGVG